MTAIPVRGTHYMTFPYTTAAVAYGLWVKTLFKNGEVIQDIPIDFHEYPAGIYTFSFENDGDRDALWTLVLHATGDTNNWFAETWSTTSKIIEQTVKQIRSRFDSDGGFFQSSVNQEVR